MNNKDLDSYLYNFTEHEKNYILKLKNEFNLKTVTEVFKNFDYIQQHSNNTYIPNSITHLKLFDCKKNSRFLNVAEHRHDYIEMNYVYSGNIIQTVNEKRMTLHQDDLIILDTQVKHSVLMPGQNDIMLAFRFSIEYFTQNFFREFKSDNLMGEFLLKSIYERQKNNRLLSFNIKDNPDIKYLLRLLTIEFIGTELETDSLKNNYILSIFNLLLRKFEKENFSGKTSTNNSKIQHYSQIVVYLEKNYQTVTLKKMSRDFGYSAAYLSNMIKNVTHQTFSSLILDIKLKNVLVLLKQTSLPISQIYPKCGFSNANYFYAKFEKKYGNTPKKYRDSLKGKIH